MTGTQTGPGAHVDIKDLAFTYPGTGAQVLDIEHLAIQTGEHVALAGATGAGKTTLLRLIDGRLQGWSGAVEVLGRALSPTRRPPRAERANIGFVFQEFTLIERASVYDNVRIGRLGRTAKVASVFGSFTDRDHTIIERAIEDVDLGEFAEQRADRLSGGQRQRVAIARCLAQEPEILIADEPVSNLDPAAAEMVLDLLKSTAEARGATLIISSHQHKLVTRYVDRMFGLKDGRIAFDKSAHLLTSKDLAGFYDLQIAQPAA